jgi:hypothetical protein
LGRNGDGGYVVCAGKAVGTYDLLLSAGISDDDSFEVDFLDKNPEARGVCFDGTVKGLPRGHPRLKFVANNVGTAPPCECLANYFGDARDVLLKLDIEGGEFDVLAWLFSAKCSYWARIKQLVVEFHQLTSETVPLLRLISESHRLCHLHPNNAGGLKMVDGVWVPEFFECTYLRSAEMYAAPQDGPSEESDLDVPNCPYRPELRFVNKIDPMFEMMQDALRLEDNGDLCAAVSKYSQMLSVRPNDPTANANMGLILAKRGSVKEAISSLRAAVDSDRTFGDALVALCDLYLTRVFDLLVERKYAEALATAEEAVRVGWDREPPWVALGLSAIACKLTRKYLPFVRVACRPGFAHATKVLFIMLADAHFYTEALEMSKKIEEWDDTSLSAFAVTLMHFGMCVRAYDILRGSPAEMKTSETLNLEAGALVELGETAKAMSTYPDDGGPVNPNKLLVSNAADFLSDFEVFALHRKWAETFDNIPRTIMRPSTHDSGRKINVGYIGSDFNQHAVCHFVFNLLTGYDRSRFNVYVYDSQQKQHSSGNRVNRHIRGAVSSYVNIDEMGDEQAATRIAADDIDVLVDLASHTAGTRMGVVARKPARVLACMIGYPNTTGLKCVDCRLVDKITDPIHSKASELYTERLVRVPGCFLCYRPVFFEDDPFPAIEPTCKTAQSPVRFCCFAKPYKISDGAWRLWSQILDRVPRSTLSLKARCFSDQASTKRFLERVAALGVDTGRILLSPFTSCHDDHLRSYNGMDVSLDTFPYSGTTVTCDSLFMGVPVVTLAGDSHRQNVSASILVNSDLSHLVCASAGAYVDLAVTLAHSSSDKLSLRETFLRSSVCDGRAHARKIEQLFFEVVAK